MASIFGSISVIMIILQIIGVLVLNIEDVFHISSGAAFFIKLILIIAASVPYITLWIAASNHDKLEQLESTLNRVSINTQKPREAKTPTSSSNAKLSNVNRSSDWSCKKCGERNSNTDVSCKNCGQYR